MGLSVIWVYQVPVYCGDDIIVSLFFFLLLLLFFSFLSQISLDILWFKEQHTQQMLEGKQSNKTFVINWSPWLPSPLHFPLPLSPKEPPNEVLYINCISVFKPHVYAQEVVRFLCEECISFLNTYTWLKNQTFFKKILCTVCCGKVGMRRNSHCHEK